MRLGIIARADRTGLGNQTRNLVYMLDPVKVLVINSKLFNNNDQYYKTYQGYNAFLSNGFPSNDEVYSFLRGLDAVLTCELFYNREFVDIANRVGVRTYNQFNYEFLDNLVNPRLALPTKFLAPSKWMLEEMQARFPNVEYLPPPTDPADFASVREQNMNRTGKPRFLHVVGRKAMHSRNGTQAILNAEFFTKTDFELVIKVQAENGGGTFSNDPRIIIDHSEVENEVDLYRDFDALILPRRYAGLCLPMNEALMSGLPVIMTDVSPNNQILPSKWLVKTESDGTFMARTEIPKYTADHKDLAKKIDWLCKTDLKKEKEEAFRIGYENYSSEVLLPKYMEAIK